MTSVEGGTRRVPSFSGGWELSLSLSLSYTRSSVSSACARHKSRGNALKLDWDEMIFLLIFYHHSLSQFTRSTQVENASDKEKDMTVWQGSQCVSLHRWLGCLVVASGGGGRVQPACSCLPLPNFCPPATSPSSNSFFPLRPDGTMIISRGAARLLPPVEGCTWKEMRAAAHYVNTRVKKKLSKIFHFWKFSFRKKRKKKETLCQGKKCPYFGLLLVC